MARTKATARKSTAPRKALATKAARNTQPTVRMVHEIPIDDDIPMRRCYECKEVVPKDSAMMCYPFCVDCCFATDFGGDADYPEDWKQHYYCASCRKHNPCQDAWCNKHGYTCLVDV